jgi:peroxiredoxin
VCCWPTNKHGVLNNKTKIPGKLHLNANARRGLSKGVCKTICLEVNDVFVKKIESRQRNHSKNDQDGTIAMEILAGF